MAKFFGTAETLDPGFTTFGPLCEGASQTAEAVLHAVQLTILQQRCMQSCSCKASVDQLYLGLIISTTGETEREEVVTTPFGITLTRSQVVHRAT